MKIIPHKVNRAITFGLLTFLFTSHLFGVSQIDTLLGEKNFQEIKKIIDNTQLIYDETKLPNNAKMGDFIIIENEYGVKSFFEFYDGQWNDKVDPTIAKILENDSGTTYGNLFNYKVDATEFNPYESDNFKYTQETTSRVKIKILNSLNNEFEINNILSKFLKNEHIDGNEIINIQIEDLDKKNSKIIVIYK